MCNVLRCGGFVTNLGAVVGGGGAGVADLQIGVLGPLVVSRGGVSRALGPRLAVLLSVLVMEAGRGVSAHRLVDMLWGGDAPDSARATLRSHVSHLRRALGGGGIAADDPDASSGRHGGPVVVTMGSGAGVGYRLDVDPERVDVFRFERRCAEGSGLLAANTTGHEQRAVEVFADGLALWRGPAFAQVADLAFAQAHIGRLDTLRWSARYGYAQALARCGRRTEAIGLLVSMTAEDPYDEAVRRSLALSLYAEHRIEEAARVCREGVLLLRERGLDAPELDALQQAVLRREVPQAEQARPARHGRQAESGAPVEVPRMLPPDVTRFVGREEQLTHARLHLRDGATLLVTGSAGVGKTSLVTRLAHLAVGDFPDGQLYVDLRGFDEGRALDPATALRRFLDALGVPTARTPRDVEAQAALYRATLTGRRVLVVLDNASHAAQVRPLLPGVPSCAAVVTSRSQLLGLVAIDGAHPSTLDVMTVPEARDLLAARIGHARLAAAPDAADDVIGLCARLPLALAIVASRTAARPHVALDAVAGELRESGDLSAWTTEDPAADVRTVFSWSYRALKHDCAALFRLLGLHPGPSVSLAAVAAAAGVSQPSARAVLRTLCEAHLVSEPSHGRYACHDLLRAYAGELLHLVDDDSTRRAATRRLLDYYLHSAYRAARQLVPNRRALAPPDCDPGVTPEQFGDDGSAMAWLRVEYPVLCGVIQLAARHGLDRHAYQIPWALAGFFERNGHFTDWLLSQQEALSAARRLADPQMEASSHVGLAAVNARLGHLDTVLEHLGHADRLYRELGDRDGRAYVQLCMGWAYGPRGQDRQALGSAKAALRLYIDAGNHNGQAMARNNIGWFHAQLGEYGEALANCRSALEQLRASGNLYWEGRTWESLGYIHHRLGEHTEAVTCYQAALDRLHDIGNRPYATQVMARLAETYQALGDLQAARHVQHDTAALLAELARGGSVLDATAK
jgi:DNA-binding SARP family transcriptional activator/tetratricopeptide (TPR) repeat protein